MALISLVYVSASTTTMTDDELRAILDEARAFNATKNITGMLLYRDGFFIQALEGEESEVKSLYEGIKGDPRHENVILVSTEPIKERTFSQWSMGFNKFSAEDGADLPGFTDFLENPNADFFTNSPAHAAKLLNSFKEHSYF